MTSFLKSSLIKNSSWSMSTLMNSSASLRMSSQGRSSWGLSRWNVMINPGSISSTLSVEEKKLQRWKQSFMKESRRNESKSSSLSLWSKSLKNEIGYRRSWNKSKESILKERGCSDKTKGPGQQIMPSEWESASTIGGMGRLLIIRIQCPRSSPMRRDWFNSFRILSLYRDSRFFK